MVGLFPADEFEHPRIEFTADLFVFLFRAFPVPLGGINGLEIDKSRLLEELLVALRA